MNKTQGMDVVWHQVDKELGRRERTWAWLARQLGETDQTVNNWKRRGVPARQHAAIAQVFGWSVDRLLGIADAPIELENNPDYPSVRRVRIKVVGGITGYAVEYQDEDDGPPIVFRRDWYTSNGFNPAKMLAMRVTGESMVPNLRAGDLIIINTEQTQPKDGVAFVVSYEGEPVVKRLVRDQGEWWLTSDNSDQRRFPRKRCDENATLIGEVVYRQTEHI